jgi:hypothetical protein
MIISFLLEKTFIMLGYSFLEFEKKINLTLFLCFIIIIMQFNKKKKLILTNKVIQNNESHTQPLFLFFKNIIWYKKKPHAYGWCIIK